MSVGPKSTINKIYYNYIQVTYIISSSIRPLHNDMSIEINPFVNR